LDTEEVCEDAIRDRYYNVHVQVLQGFVDIILLL
jgi:hypothetical protein